MIAQTSVGAGSEQDLLGPLAGTIEWLRKANGPRRLFVDGAWIKPRDGKCFSSINPANGKVLAEIHEAGEHEVNLAVKAAHAAFEGGWSRMKPLERQRLLLKVADHIEANFDDLAMLDTLDMGAPLSRTRNQSRVAVGMLRYYAGIAPAICGDTIENSVPGEFVTYTLKEPVGVVAAILAWNGPLGSSIRKIAPALAAGCTLVVKPSEYASLTVLRLAELFEEAGLPPGVLNVVCGAGDVGAFLAAHPNVDMVSFTGSQAVGAKVVQASSTNFKKVMVELGGKSADIVFADADMDIAVAGAAMAIFANSGQVCSAGSRLLVEDSIYDGFLERVADYSNRLVVGNGLDPVVEIGPVVSARQFEKIKSFIAAGQEDGARIVTASSGRLVGDTENGYFVHPTIFADVRSDMRICREEIFGPVLSALRFSGVKEAIQIANGTPFGLGSGLWTQDVNKAHFVSRRLRSGSVWINCYNNLDPSVPFGGYKTSGYGRERGREHIEEHFEVKAVWTRIMDPT